ncbi:hypothetical protein EM20IM_03925 [Candidatus Methylacidiphilum infernorum]|uniref:Uncharacterized protein n=1 Tax=Candidatus Methylacidiphilum infernorum TaxID=511746 RepID=A0ABX7PXN5_9BACT|nr:hypothetical protein [Candidatus Methylacidiphilum infernorum]QSR87479.1 hypothetical protein EM20IM_03925 [Candidatus Methylacidiphilum infernorum]
MRKTAWLIGCLFFIGLFAQAQTPESEELDKAIEQAQKQLEKQQGATLTDNRQRENRSQSSGPVYSPKKGRLVSAQDFAAYIKKHKAQHLWVYGHFKVIQVKKNRQLVAKPAVKGFIPLISSFALPKTHFVFLNPQNLRNFDRLSPGDSFYISPRHPALVIRIISKNKRETLAKALLSSQPKNHLLSSKSSPLSD